MNSAVYEGTVVHRRLVPVVHEFRTRIALPLLDLDELDDVCALHPLWSRERMNVVSFRRADYLGDPAVPLATAVRNLVEERLGLRPTGPVLMLAHVRTWGWLFNPIACYYALGADGAVEAFVAEVTNTPWHERHAYVVAADRSPTQEHWFDKELHVSPFFEMDHRYRLRFTVPGDRLSVTLDNHRDGRPVFHAALTGRRRAMSRAALARILWRYPLMTFRVSGGIYGQAARLRARAVPFQRHPRRVPAAPGAAPPERRP